MSGSLSVCMYVCANDPSDFSQAPQQNAPLSCFVITLQHQHRRTDITQLLLYHSTQGVRAYLGPVDRIRKKKQKKSSTVSTTVMGVSAPTVMGAPRVVCLHTSAPTSDPDNRHFAHTLYHTRLASSSHHGHHECPPKTPSPIHRSCPPSILNGPKQERKRTHHRQKKGVRAKPLMCVALRRANACGSFERVGEEVGRAKP